MAGNGVGGQVAPAAKARGPRMVRKARARLDDAATRSREWVDRQEPDSSAGVTIGAWRRYEAVDGPLQSALLSLYILVAVVPALLVMSEYLERNPAALANHMASHYGLSAATASLVRGVFVHDRTHELGALMWISRFVMEKWLNFYASDYGGLGVVMAIFFWVAFSSAVVVIAASLAPALAQRRDVRVSRQR
jgi:hypothetical protein